MKPRIYFLLFLAFASLNLFAQPKIASVTYDGDEATLTRNFPPTGIVYYWQGTSCGELTDNSDTTYIATTSSTYFLRGYDNTAGEWNASCATTSVFFADVTIPILSDVTEGPIKVGDIISAISNENGIVYLVPDGTLANIGAIGSAKVDEDTATEYVAVSLSTDGTGDYIVYAVDKSDNVSAASAVIVVNDLTGIDLNKVTSGEVQLYPVNVKDILHIKSRTSVSSAIVYTLQGTQVIMINTPTESIDMSGLNEGVYIVSIKLVNNTIFNGKVIKK